MWRYLILQISEQQKWLVQKQAQTITHIPVMTPVISLPTSPGNVYILVYTPVLSNDYPCCVLLSYDKSLVAVIELRRTRHRPVLPKDV